MRMFKVVFGNIPQYFFFTIIISLGRGGGMAIELFYSILSSVLWAGNLSSVPNEAKEQT